MYCDMKKIKKQEWIVLPAGSATTSQGSVEQHTLNRIAQLGLPLKTLQKIANEFGTYVDVKLQPLKHKRSRDEVAPKKQE